MKKYQIVSVGTALEDIAFYTADAEIMKNPKNDPTKLKLIAFEYGAKIHSDEIFHSFGGGAANTATGIARLKVKNAALVNIGTDVRGDAIMESFTRTGIDTSLVQQDSKHDTGFSFLVVEKGSNEHVVFAHYGANKYLQVSKSLLKTFRTDWFYVSSLSMDHWSTVMRNLISTKANISWNPGSIQLKQPDIIKKLLPGITVLIVNKDEATELCLTSGYTIPRGKREANIRKLAQHLYALGSNKVLITNGRHGSHVYDGEKFYFAKPSPDRPKDTTGAGDCFGSSFTTGLVKFKGDIQKALHLGVVNSTALVGEVGAQHGLLTWAEAQKKLKRI